MTILGGGTSATEQAHALESRAGARLRPDLSAIRVRGDDRLSWLSGQVTNDLRKLDGAALPTSLRTLAVNVRGKILADLWVANAPEHLLLLVPRSAQAALLESFERYIIMEDVTLEPWEDAQVVSLQGPRSAELTGLVEAGSALGFHLDELRLGGHAWVGNEGAVTAIRAVLHALGVPEVDETSYELARVRAGVARYGVDFGERNYPQEAGLKRWVSFSKGCYLGQEVVCTLENRGRLTRRLSLLRGPGETPPPAGTVLTDIGGETLGEITSAIFDPDAAELLAIGYVKRAQAVPNQILMAAGAELSIARVLGDEVSEPT